jgi:hypothetical protein
VPVHQAVGAVAADLGPLLDDGVVLAALDLEEDLVVGVGVVKADAKLEAVLEPLQRLVHEREARAVEVDAVDVVGVVALGPGEGVGHEVVARERADLARGGLADDVFEFVARALEKVFQRCDSRCVRAASAAGTLRAPPRRRRCRDDTRFRLVAPHRRGARSSVAPQPSRRRARRGGRVSAMAGQRSVPDRVRPGGGLWRPALSCELRGGTKNRRRRASG